MSEQEGSGGGADEGNKQPTVAELQGQLKAEKEKTAASEKSAQTFKNEAATNRVGLKELQGKFDEISKQKAAGSTDGEEIRKHMNDIVTGKDEVITKQAATIDQLGNDLKIIRVDGKIASVANKLGAINIDQVTTLLKGKISFDTDGNTVIKDAQGSALKDDKGNGVSIEAFTKSFLEANTHLMNGSGNSGSGSTPAGSGGSAGGKYKSVTDFASKVSQAVFNAAAKKHGGIANLQHHLHEL